MAILKGDGYGDKTYRFETGDEEFDKENSDELAFSKDEILRVINAEGVVDKLFKRCLKERSKRHEALKNKLAGG